MINRTFGSIATGKIIISTCESPQIMSVSKSRELRSVKSNLFCPLTGELSQNKEQSTGTNNYIVYVSLKQNPTQTFNISLGQQATIQDAINAALDILDENRQQTLEPLNFDMYIVKKNGKPKYDYPPFEYDQLLLKTGTQSFAMVKKPHFQPKRDSHKSKSDLTTPHRRDNEVRSYENSLHDLNSPNNLLEIVIEEKSQKKTWLFSILNCSFPPKE